MLEFLKKTFDFITSHSELLLGSGLIGIIITEIANWSRSYWKNNWFKFSYLKELEDMHSRAVRHKDDIEKNGLFDEKQRIIKHDNIPFIFLDYIISQLPYIIRKPNFFAGMVRLRAAIFSYRELHDHIISMDISCGLTDELKTTNQNLYAERLKRIIIECETQFFVQENTNGIKINPLLERIFQRRYDKLPKEREKILEKQRKQGKINDETCNYIKNKIIK